MTRVKHLLARKGRDVWSVDAKQPVLEAIRIMAERHVGALPVLSAGALIGVLSERDYARKVVLLGRSSADTPVSQIMSSPAFTVTPGRNGPALHGDHDGSGASATCRWSARASLVGVISIGDCVRAVIDEQQDTIQQLERFISG
jgi:CBS domain-containing protein